MEHYHKDLKSGDLVKIKGFESGSKLNDLTGTIVGVSSRHIVDVYIVLLDAPITWSTDFENMKAICIPESHLDRV